MYLQLNNKNIFYPFEVVGRDRNIIIKSIFLIDDQTTGRYKTAMQIIVYF